MGLVTRNTTESVDAFFATIGEEWRSCFDVLLTRDNTPHVKPDPRSLLHFSEVGRQRSAAQGGCQGWRGAACWNARPFSTPVWGQ